MIRRLAIGATIVVLVAAVIAVGSAPIRGPATYSLLPDASIVATDAAGMGIGQKAPDFVGTDGREPLLMDLDGRPIHLADFAGRPLWIVFWATWCSPCQQESADIRAAYHTHRADGLAVLAIDTQEPSAVVRDYVRTHDLDYAIGLDATAAVKIRYGAVGLPAHLFVDGGGVIRDRYLGQLTAGLMAQHLHTIVGS